MLTPWADVLPLQREGIPNGKGTMTYPDGSRYNGQWKDGVRHGVGTFDGADGRRYFGEWQDGKRHGQGQFLYVLAARALESTAVAIADPLVW